MSLTIIYVGGKEMKKLLLLALSLILIFGGVTVLAGNIDPDSEISVIVNKTIGGKTPEEHKAWVAELEEHLGFKVNLIRPESDYNEALNRRLASGEIVDIIHLNFGEVPPLVAQGALQDMRPFLNKSEILTDGRIPDSEFKRVTYEGTIYGIPTKYEGALVPIINTEWMEEIGKEPTDFGSMDTWMEYFRYAKKEYGAYALASSYNYQPFAGYFGLREGLAEDGSVPYASEKAIPFWQWLADLYAEGLVHPDFESRSSGQMRDALRGGNPEKTVSMIVYWDAWVRLFNLDADMGEGFATAVYPPVGPEGGSVSYGDVPVFARPVNAPKGNEDLVKRFIEFWHSDPGYMLTQTGVKGLHYTEDENGKLTLTELGKKRGLDHGAPNVTNAEWENPFAIDRGYNAARAISIKFGQPVMKDENFEDIRDIVYRFGFKAVKGDITAEEAVEKMRTELKANRYID